MYETVWNFWQNNTLPVKEMVWLEAQEAQRQLLQVPWRYRR